MAAATLSSGRSRSWPSRHARSGRRQRGPTRRGAVWPCGRGTTPLEARPLAALGAAGVGGARGSWAAAERMRACSGAETTNSTPNRACWRPAGTAPDKGIIGQNRKAGERRPVSRPGEAATRCSTGPSGRPATSARPPQSRHSAARQRPRRPRPARHETLTHDYKRHGTTNLYAAFNVATGEVLGRLTQRHHATEFRQFLTQIDRATPPALALHLIVDTAHTRPKRFATSWLPIPAFNCTSHRRARHGPRHGSTPLRPSSRKGSRTSPPGWKR